MLSKVESNFNIETFILLPADCWAMARAKLVHKRIQIRMKFSFYFCFMMTQRKSLLFAFHEMATIEENFCDDDWHKQTTYRNPSKTSTFSLQDENFNFRFQVEGNLRSIARGADASGAITHKVVNSLLYCSGFLMRSVYLAYCWRIRRRNGGDFLSLKLKIKSVFISAGPVKSSQDMQSL